MEEFDIKYFFIGFFKIFENFIESNKNKLEKVDRPF